MSRELRQEVDDLKGRVKKLEAHVFPPGESAIKGEDLRAAREAADWSMAELAAKIGRDGVTRNAVWGWEHGQWRISEDRAEEIRQAFIKEGKEPPR